MCFYAPHSVYLHFSAVHSPCILVVSEQKCDALIVYEPGICVSIQAGKLNMGFLSHDRAVLFKAACLCKCPLVAVRLNSVSQYTKTRRKAMREPRERALKQTRLKILFQ